ncbi:MAG: uracil-DNA glycosylase [Candidatus Cloacimonadota bacterium]|nr:MAG: uracil-DNA glycosylase [Candidatus Cloacimonadota bacterium]PCJ21031.1 MAG: uracil-DNA glycosylase [Candidatus Cloacimonadota bacterium]
MCFVTEKSWEPFLKEEFSKNYYLELQKYLSLERKIYSIYPPKNLLFEALNLTSLDQVKVIILGQDPYHGAAQAHGLCFSILPSSPIPKSLNNIYKELQSDLSYPPPNHGNLESWARQGVLLLNTVLTVREGEAGSHKNQGWEIFTDNLLKKLCQKKKNLVFVLWGKDAQKKEVLLQGEHYIIKSAHPSPLAAYRGFFGSKPFSKTNSYLQEKKIKNINWRLDDI